MGDILFLCHRIPFPPDRGDKIRSHHLLKALADVARVHVATFYDDDQDLASEHELAALAASHCLIRRGKSLPAAGIEALLSGKPLSLTAFDDQRMRRYICDVLTRHDITTVVLFSGQMGQYIPKGFRGRVISDLVDVDSAKFEAYAARSAWPRAWIERREARLLRAEEARIVGISDITLLVSEEEAGLLRSRLPRAALGDRVRGMGNGMDSVGFDPACVIPEPRMQAKDGPRLIFTGQMDYMPNVDAVLRAIDRIMPLVRAVFPTASLHVVGRNPAPVLQARHGRDGVEVWGRVDDIRPWLAAADLALVPLEIARGVQNKVLEAMAMRLPVVLSSGAATGIPAQDRREFRVADSDAGLAAAVIELARNPEMAADMGRLAREWIVANASWSAALADLPRLLAFEAQALSDAA